MAVQIMVAKNSFIYQHDGVETTVRKGATVRVGHPILKGNEVHFKPFTVDFDTPEPAAAKKAGA